MKRILIGTAIGASLVVFLLATLIGGLIYAPQISWLVKNLYDSEAVRLEQQNKALVDEIWTLRIELDKKDLGWEQKLKGMVREIDRLNRERAEREDWWIDRQKDLKQEIEDLNRSLEDVYELLSKHVDAGFADLRDFESHQKLLGFLSTVSTDTMRYAEDKWDCDDYPILLSLLAAEQNYRVFPAIFISHQGNTITGLHIRNFAFVGYYMQGKGYVQRVAIIEPQSLEIVYIGIRDKPETWVDKIVDILP